MLRETIIRAWKDPQFRMGLSAQERAEVPESPAGSIELTDEELDMATGGHSASSGSSSSSSGSSGSSVACNRRVRWPSEEEPTDNTPDNESPTERWRRPRPRPSVKGSSSRPSTRRSYSSYR